MPGGTVESKENDCQGTEKVGRQIGSQATDEECHRKKRAIQRYGASMKGRSLLLLLWRSSCRTTTAHAIGVGVVTSDQMQ